MQPEVIMDPVTFQSEVNQEDYQHFRLPVAYIQDQSQHWRVLSCGDHEIEPLLFPVLYPWGQGYWRAKPFHQCQPFQDMQAEDAKIKLSSIIPHYRIDHYWPAWIYMEIEAHCIL